MYFGISACCSVWMQASSASTSPRRTTCCFLHLGRRDEHRLRLYVGRFQSAFPSLSVTCHEKPARFAKFLFIFPHPITDGPGLDEPAISFYYRVFAVVAGQLVFGPWLLVAASNNYICMVAGVVLFLTFVCPNPPPENQNRLYTTQRSLFSLSNLIPSWCAAGVTLGFLDLSIAATPISFITTVVFSGFGHIQFHMLDIKTHRHAARASTGFQLLPDPQRQGLVITSTVRSARCSARSYNFAENRYLREAWPMKTRPRKRRSTISLPHRVLPPFALCRILRAVSRNAEAGGYAKNYYIVERHDAPHRRRQVLRLHCHFQGPSPQVKKACSSSRTARRA
jgi:hypothetical protein